MNKKKYKYDRIKPNVDVVLPTIVVEAPPGDLLHEEDSETNLTEMKNDHSGMNEKDRDVETEMGIRKECLGRRNSVSLPNLDELKVFSSDAGGQDEDYDGQSINDADKNDIIEDDGIDSISGYPRNARRKSVLSPRMHKSPGEDVESGANSPAMSVTSGNSIASLLREKIQNLPQTIRKKKSPEYKTKIFVTFLFIAIVVLIVTSYCLYNQKVLAKAYFEKIKFNNVKRLMKIHNNEGIVVLHATLGTTLNYDKVLPCLPRDDHNDGSLCLEWMHRARLYLSHHDLDEAVKCYNLHWMALSQSVAPTDCFDMSNGHWYGGGQTAGPAWPLERANRSFGPFITGRTEERQWGNVLKRYFISSRGVAIIVDDTTPLHVSIRHPEGEPPGGKKELCLRAQYDNFAFVHRFSPSAQLNYSVCVGSNMSELHNRLGEHTLWDGLKKEDSHVIDSLLTEPVWEVTARSQEELTEETIYNFTEDITNSVGIMKQGHVLINEFWQKQIGDFEVDIERFPTLETTLEMLKRRGFRVVFTVQPFISTESFNFAEAVRKRLLVSERSGDPRIPALTRYKSVQSAGVLDITNERTVPWLVDKLKKVMHKYKFDAFHLDMGTAHDTPPHYQCERPLANPDHYRVALVHSVAGAVPVFGVGGAVERPRPPAFVLMPPIESSWTGLGRVVPTLLTYGVLGYPFLMPGAVGGDYDAPQNILMKNGTQRSLPDEELYIRWLQLAAFLPVVRYHHLPSSYGNQNISEIAKSLALTRQNKVTPKLKKFARVALNIGLPLIRPLWMLDSEDPNCHQVLDEFSIGDEIIVAPILDSGVRQREVYLPAGVWKDGIDGGLRKGNRWIHDYRVEENQVAYFERMPDDTRF